MSDVELMKVLGRLPDRCAHPRRTWEGILDFGIGSQTVMQMKADKIISQFCVGCARPLVADSG